MEKTLIWFGSKLKFPTLKEITKSFKQTYPNFNKSQTEPTILIWIKIWSALPNQTEFQFRFCSVGYFRLDRNLRVITLAGLSP